MKATPAISAALLTAAMLTTGGCSKDGNGPSAAETEALVTREARAALTISAKALGASGTRADAGWFDCVPNMAWSYRGGGTFIVAHGDVSPRLTAVRTALVEAGYTDVTKVAGKVAVERGEVTFVIGPQRIGTQPERWSFSYQSRCRGYAERDRARVKADDRRNIAPPPTRS